MQIATGLTLDHFYQMAELERCYYADDFIASAEDAYRWYQCYPQSILAVIENQVIIGFMNLFPIKKDIFKAILNGTFNDKYLTNQHIQRNRHQSHYLFLSCVVIRESHRQSPALRLLLHTYSRLYADYPIQWIITDNVTIDGEQFSAKMGMKKIGPSDHHSNIYLAEWPNFLKRIR